MQLEKQERNLFQETVWGYYAAYGRVSLPWRQPEKDGQFNPYKIMVSELMLQQTQVTRVIPKYDAFLAKFPNVQALANATLGDVLRSWQGLGYNRRAKFLWMAARQLHDMSTFPSSHEQLVQLPGVGKNTAGAILAYAFNQPVVFIETNVRTVYIHHFFSNQTEISDKQIMELVAQTIDTENPREWYWAVMDYGSHLKATRGNLNHASKHFTRQSTFHGSRRQVRGQIIRLLGEKPYTLLELQDNNADERLGVVLQELVVEGLVQQNDGRYSLD